MPSQTPEITTANKFGFANCSGFHTNLFPHHLFFFFLFDPFLLTDALIFMLFCSVHIMPFFSMHFLWSFPQIMAPFPLWGTKPLSHKELAVPGSLGQLVRTPNTLPSSHHQTQKSLLLIFAPCYWGSEKGHLEDIYLGTEGKSPEDTEKEQNALLALP